LRATGQHGRKRQAISTGVVVNGCENDKDESSAQVQIIVAVF